jgi:regulatory protein
MEEDRLLEKATSLALRFLSYRPRSESEVRRRLEAKFAGQVAESVVQRLTEQGLLDDTSFAQEWTRSRVSHRPRSAKAIRRELLGKGVDRDTAQAAVETLDDEESAYRAGLRAAASLADTDYTTFRRRLQGYLYRRGFSQAVIRRTANRLWEEREAVDHSSVAPAQDST